MVTQKTSFSRRIKTTTILHELIHYNPIDGYVTRLAKWSNRHKIGEVLQAKGRVQRFRIFGQRKELTHWIWLYQTGQFPEGVIDHIDGNHKNNVWTNLRDVTQAVNLSNKHKAQTNNRLGILGVDKLNGKYRARLKRPGVKSTHIGMFNTAAEAYNAYVTERGKHFPVEGL